MPYPDPNPWSSPYSSPEPWRTTTPQEQATSSFADATQRNRDQLLNQWGGTEKQDQQQALRDLLAQVMNDPNSTPDQQRQALRQGDMPLEDPPWYADLPQMFGPGMAQGAAKAAVKNPGLAALLGAAAMGGSPEIGPLAAGAITRLTGPSAPWKTWVEKELMSRFKGSNALEFPYITDDMSRMPQAILTKTPDDVTKILRLMTNSSRVPRKSPGMAGAATDLNRGGEWLGDFLLSATAGPTPPANIFRHETGHNVGDWLWRASGFKPRQTINDIRGEFGRLMGQSPDDMTGTDVRNWLGNMGQSVAQSEPDLWRKLRFDRGYREYPKALFEEEILSRHLGGSDPWITRGLSDEVMPFVNAWEQIAASRTHPIIDSLR
jgi:hypothetical protein